MNTADPTSLDRLHDLVVPPATPFWPPAPGWLWLLALAGFVALVLGLRGLAHWQRNRYRREALRMLAAIETDLAQPAEARSALLELSVLLKRVAMTAYGRTDVAALTGDEWFAFLDRKGGTAFNTGLGHSMAQALYVGPDDQVPAAGVEPVDTTDLVAAVREWIRKHPSC